MIKKIYNAGKKYGFIKIGTYYFKKIGERLNMYVLQKSLSKNMMNPEFEKEFKTNIKSIFDDEDKILYFYNNNEKIKKKILSDAENIIEHKFDLLGSGLVSLGNKIKWNQDFKSNFIWENQFFRNIKIVDLSNDADVKIPWELSRFQHLFTLGKAFWITKEKKYYNEAKKQIEDWIESNPPYNSVNWTCAMDVAIRAVNLILFYFQFRILIEKDKEFLKSFNNLLYIHGQYIYLNLEKGLGFATNHYLSDLVGLLWLGLYFDSLKNSQSKKWLSLAMKELEKEMVVQNNKDGTNYEASTNYHKLVLELLFFSVLIAEKNNIEFSDGYKSRLKKMFRFLASITKLNGLFPMIGDVDNGRLVILSNYYDWTVNDASEILNLGSRYFKTCFFKPSNSNYYSQEAEVILFGNNQFCSKNDKLPIQYQDGGYYILKNKNFHCVIRCGELSCHGIGGHSHNDQLSFELNIKGEDFIVDSGTGVYTSSKKFRNLFRSTAMHNTVSVHGIEQNDFNEEELFLLQEQTFAKCINFNSKIFEGEHYGFLDKIGSTHKRKIYLDAEEIKIYDYLIENEGICNINIAPDIEIIEQKNSVKLVKNDVKVIIKFEDSTFKVLDSYFSPAYGVIKESKKLEVYFKNNNCLKIILED